MAPLSGKHGMGLFMVLMVAFAVARATIIVQPSFDLLYSQAPRLKIRATGFPADVRALTLELSVQGEPSLTMYTDYMLSLDPDHEGIVLNLKAGKRLVSLVTG